MSLNTTPRLRVAALGARQPARAIGKPTRAVINHMRIIIIDIFAATTAVTATKFATLFSNTAVIQIDSRLGLDHNK